MPLEILQRAAPCRNVPVTFTLDLMPGFVVLFVLSLGGALYLFPYWQLLRRRGRIAETPVRTRLIQITCPDTLKPEYQLRGEILDARGRKIEFDLYPWHSDNAFQTIDAAQERLRSLGVAGDLLTKVVLVRTWCGPRPFGTGQLSPKAVREVRHMSRTPGSPFWPGSVGAEFQSAFAPQREEQVFEKNVPDAFVHSGLERWLRVRDIDRLVIVGVATHNSVESTARTAGNLGFRATVVSDATFTFDKSDFTGRLRTADEVHAMSLANLAGEYADVQATAEVLRAFRLQGGMSDRADR